MTNPQYDEDLSRVSAARPDDFTRGAGRMWTGMTLREFDSKAKDQPLTLFGAPDECGSFDTLF